MLKIEKKGEEEILDSQDNSFNDEDENEMKKIQNIKIHEEINEKK